VLLTGFLALVVGFELLYSGIKSGDSWKKPWQPLSNAFNPPGGAGATATQGA